jgi:hypothetical protein
VEGRFPVGTPERKLRQELRHLGFRTRYFFEDTPSPTCTVSRCAALYRWNRSLKLGHEWRIEWETDQDHRITDIRTGETLWN